MSDYKIEKNIPIPRGNGGGPKGLSKYPFAQMEVGDSFECGNPKAVGVAANHAKKRLGWNFTTRGNRCWRIA